MIEKICKIKLSFTCLAQGQMYGVFNQNWNPGNPCTTIISSTSASETIIITFYYISGYMNVQ